jgi:hypothetical protein
LVCLETGLDWRVEKMDLHRREEVESWWTR